MSPQRSDLLFDGCLQFFQRGEHPVACGVFDKVSNALNGVEFRAVGRQGQQPDIGGQAIVV